MQHMPIPKRERCVKSFTLDKKWFDYVFINETLIILQTIFLSKTILIPSSNGIKVCGGV